MIDKKILIIGSNGFIGKNLKNHLKDNYGNNNYEYCYLTREKVDLKDNVALKKYMHLNKPNIVINASGVVGSSMLNQEKNNNVIFDENVLILMNILEYCEEIKIEKLILFSTYRLFGEEVRENYDENDMNDGIIKNNMGYLESKRCQNTQMELFMKRNKMKIICLIMPNIFGEEDQYIMNGRIVPSFITKIINAKRENKNISIESSPKNQLNLIYVKDIVKIVEQTIEKEDEKLVGNIMIFNKNGIIEIEELAKKIAQIVGYQGMIQFNEERAR
jgi:nucleoside-diphosphate-sugar epimerase